MAAVVNLSEEEIRRILLSEKPSRVIAREMHLTPALISRIRRGILYPDACPDTPRWPKSHILSCGRFIHRDSKCEQCIHYGGCTRVWKGEKYSARIHNCDLGIPEIQSMGLYFARQCPAFTPNPCLQHHSNNIGPTTTEERPAMVKASNASMQSQPA